MDPIWQFTGELSNLVYRLFPVCKMRMEMVRKGLDAYLSIRYILPRPAILPSVEWLHSAVEALRGGPYATTCRIHHYDDQGRWPSPVAGYIHVIVLIPHGQ